MLNRSRFSEKVLERDPMLAYRSMSFKMVYQFLNWHLNQKTGYSGRRTSGIQSQSSLITFWCLFRLSFERATNYKIDKVIDGRRLSNVWCSQNHIPADLRGCT